MRTIHKQIAAAVVATALVTSVAVSVKQPIPVPVKVTVDTLRIGPADIYPNPITQPGALNPDITQENITQNICAPSGTWSTKSIRPSVSYTNKLKAQQIKDYGYADTNMASYEEDHIISLELGGNPTDPKNLYPEPYIASIADGGAKKKDTVENFLHRQVCSGAITLQEAQHEISTDWYKVLKTNNL